jgi:phosphoglycerate dehydrogenase-like enzyme
LCYGNGFLVKDPAMDPLIVVIGEDIGAANLARLQRAFPQVTFRLCLDAAEFTAAAADAQVLFSKSFPPAALAGAQRLRWVQAGTAGVERLLAAGLIERGVLLTNAHGAHGAPISELILSMMLAFATGLHTLIRVQTERRHIQQEIIRTKFELEGQTLCVIGLGDIGGTLARKAQALGMRVIGVRRTGRPHPHVDQIFPVARLTEALGQADHVALCLPHTGATHGLLGAAELRAMQPTAYVYNVGRGGAIDPDSLIQALQEGWIAGAGLDVTAPEPLPPDSPLWAMPNVILGQHTSGSSPYNADRITRIFEANLARFLAGEPLQQVVDATRGY